MTAPYPAPTARHPSAQANGLGLEVQIIGGLKGRDPGGRDHGPLVRNALEQADHYRLPDGQQ